MVNCINAISKSVVENCSAPLVAGYTGRGLLLQWKDGITLTPTATNPRIFSNIALATGHKAIAIDNVVVGGDTPFTGSNAAGNVDDVRRKVLKTLTFNAPVRGGDASYNLLEGLYEGNGDGQGFVVIVEKKDKRGLGTYEVIGAESPFYINADGITRDEYANGGAYVLTGSCKETGIEYSLFDTSLSTTKTLFETLYANAYGQDDSEE